MTKSMPTESFRQVADVHALPRLALYGFWACMFDLLLGSRKGLGVRIVAWAQGLGCRTGLQVPSLEVRQKVCLGSY